NGTLDTSFGNRGTVTTSLGPSGFYGNNNNISDVAILGDGKIVVAGTVSSTNYPGGDNFLLARYTANGKLDSTFGSGGIVATDFGGADHGAGLVLQGDGKLVVAGETTPPNGAGPS